MGKTKNTKRVHITCLHGSEYFYKLPTLQYLKDNILEVRGVFIDNIISEPKPLAMDVAATKIQRAYRMYQERKA